jgi:hypothetical protein
MSAWSHRIDPTYFGILGGEPLLNPDIENFVRVCRKHWRHVIEFVTNGFLLHKFPSILNTLRQNCVRLIISKHHASPEYEEKWKEVVALVKDWDGDKLIRPSVNIWTRRHKGWGTEALPYEDCDPSQSWNVCPCRECKQLMDGKLWKCPKVAYLPLQKKRWPDISPKWDQYLAYQPLEPTCSDEELKEFFGQKVEDVCSMCPASLETFHKPSPLITVGELTQRLRSSSAPRTEAQTDHDR